jgi:hypothetical protein
MARSCSGSNASDEVDCSPSVKLCSYTVQTHNLVSQIVVVLVEACPHLVQVALLKENRLQLKDIVRT